MPTLVPPAAAPRASPGQRRLGAYLPALRTPFGLERDMVRQFFIEFGTTFVRYSVWFPVLVPFAYFVGYFVGLVA